MSLSMVRENCAAELEQVVKIACLTAFQDSGRRVTVEDLETARPTVTPLAESRGEQLGALRTGHEWHPPRPGE